MRNLKLAIVALFILGLGACKDDEETIVDIQDPEIEISGISEGTIVWNNVPLKFEVNSEVEKVEVYINGELEKTFEEAPFEHTWNATSLEDGEYSIKAIAFGKDGSKKELLVKVKLKNTLLKLTVGADYLAESGSSKERGFIFISDNDGKTVFFEEYFNGSVISIKRPLDFTSSEFVLTNFTEQDYFYQNRPMVYIDSYFLNEIDEWNLKSSEEEDPNNGIGIGQATLNFANYSDYESIFMSDFYSSSTMYDLSSEATFSLFQPNSDIFLVLQGAQDNKFKIVKDLKKGEEREVDLSVTEKNKVTLVSNTFFSKSLSSFSWDLEGYYNGDLHKNLPLSSAYTQSENLRFVYPEGVFQKFRTVFWGMNDKVEYYTAIIGEIPDAVEFIDVEYNLVNTEVSKLEVSITGSWDFYTVMWNNQNDEGASVSLDWTVQAGEDRLTIKLPELPSEINKIYPGIDFSKFDLDETAITEVDEFDGYKGYIAAASQTNLAMVKGKYKIAWFDNQSNGENNGRKTFSPRNLKRLNPYKRN